jgi:hypothetical protein
VTPNDVSASRRDIAIVAGLGAVASWALIALAVWAFDGHWPRERRSLDGDVATSAVEAWENAGTLLVLTTAFGILVFLMLARTTQETVLGWCLGACMSFVQAFFLWLLLSQLWPAPDPLVTGVVLTPDFAIVERTGPFTLDVWSRFLLRFWGVVTATAMIAASLKTTDPRNVPSWRTIGWRSAVWWGFVALMTGSIFVVAHLER